MRSTLRRAYDCVAHYRAAFDSAGVNPDDPSWNDTRTNATTESIIHGAVNLSLHNTITVDGFTIERTSTNEGSQSPR